MKLSYYFKNANIIAGSTWREKHLPEQNNMALHVGRNVEDVVENRKRLANLLGMKLSDFVCSEQTHSDHFYEVTKDDKGRGSLKMETAIPDTDALYTYEPGIILCCFTADCVPVFFYNEQSGVVGVIHSGWKGTVSEIVGKVFHQLIEADKNDPSKFHVHLGACLSQQKFAVDEDVERQFASLNYADEWINYDSEQHKFFINNQMVIKKQCELVGISEENITFDDVCTYTDDGGFSYRQDKQAGRHLHFMMKK